MKENITLRDVSLSNDYLFTKVMMDEEICRMVLEKILQIEIEKVEWMNCEQKIDIWLKSKGVRLDYTDKKIIPI